MSIKSNRSAREYLSYGGRGCAVTQHVATLYSQKQANTPDDPACYTRKPARFVPAPRAAFVDYKQAARDIAIADARAALKARFAR